MTNGLEGSGARFSSSRPRNQLSTSSTAAFKVDSLRSWKQRSSRSHRSHFSNKRLPGSPLAANCNSSCSRFGHGESTAASVSCPVHNKNSLTRRKTNEKNNTTNPIYASSDRSMTYLFPTPLSHQQVDFADEKFDEQVKRVAGHCRSLRCVRSQHGCRLASVIRNQSNAPHVIESQYSFLSKTRLEGLSQMRMRKRHEFIFIEKG